MMNKSHRQGRQEGPDSRKTIDVRIHPTVNEGPATIRVMEQKIHRLTDTVKRQEGEISTLRRLLNNQDVIGHWEVPG